MRWETAGAGGAGDAQSSPAGEREEPSETRREEHLGPLSFKRERKDDGRTLILYERSEEPRDG